MSLLKKILNSSFWLLVGNSIGRLSIFLINIVATRLLSQETFGQFMMVRSTVSMIEGVVSGPLGSPMIKRVAEVSHQNKEYLKTVITTLFIINIIIAVILMIFLLILSPVIVNKFFLGVQNLIPALYAGALLLVSTTLATMVQSILIGLEEYKKLAFASIVSSLIVFPIIVFLIYKFALIGAVIGIACYFMFDFIIKYFQLRKLYKGNFFVIDMKFFFQESKNILIFSLPLFFSVIINSIAFWYARVLLVNTHNGFTEIAIFDAAFQWLTIIMIITGATTSIALPMLSKANEKDHKNTIFNVSLLINLFFSIVLALIFIFFSKDVMSIYGSNYIKGYNILSLLSITSIFFTTAVLYNRYFISHNNSRVIVIATLIAAIMMYAVLFTFEINVSTLAIAIMSYYITLTIVYAGVKWRKNIDNSEKRAIE